MKIDERHLLFDSSHIQHNAVNTKGINHVLCHIIMDFCGVPFVLKNVLTVDPWFCQCT